MPSFLRFVPRVPEAGLARLLLGAPGSGAGPAAGGAPIAPVPAVPPSPAAPDARPGPSGREAPEQRAPDARSRAAGRPAGTVDSAAAATSPPQAHAAHAQDLARAISVADQLALFERALRRPRETAARERTHRHAEVAKRLLARFVDVEQRDPVRLLRALVAAAGREPQDRAASASTSTPSSSAHGSHRGPGQPAAGSPAEAAARAAHALGAEDLANLARRDAGEPELLAFAVPDGDRLATVYVRDEGRRGPRTSRPGDARHLSLGLELSRLGPVRVDLWFSGPDVRLRIGFAERAALDVATARRGVLDGALAALGLDVRLELVLDPERAVRAAHRSLAPAESTGPTVEELA